VVLLTCVAGLCAAPAGCSKKDRGSEEVSRDGVVKTIDFDAQTAMIIIDDDMGNKIEFEGRFTDETVVTINGQPAKLADVSEGDTIKATGRPVQTVDEDGEGEAWVATRIDVTRLDPPAASDETAG
jgi:hypothetical protein